MDEDEVIYEAHGLFLNNTDLEIPPHDEGETTVVSAEWRFQQRRHVFSLSSHTHEKATLFEVYRINADGSTGEKLYETTDWAHPDVEPFDPPLELQPGEGLRSEVTYHNPTDQVVGFGLLSTDEMAIITGGFYFPD